jgi:hypothetical protein
VIRRVFLVLAAAAMLAGCLTSGSDAPPRPAFTPVPDQELFATIAALPGVEESDIGWPSHAYLGSITLSSDADAQLVLDTIYATLWQGRAGADITLEAQQNGTVVRLDAFEGGTSSRERLTERYGEQPGDGAPPTD